MSRLSILMVLVAAAPFAAGEASAQETIKIGAVQSMTGSFNPIGKQVMAGARLYLQEHGYTMAGKKIEILLKDDAAYRTSTSDWRKSSVARQSPLMWITPSL
jgi:branched-chain amino acid transport system substrate-binding protein